MNLKQHEHYGLELKGSISDILAMGADQLLRAWHTKFGKVPPHNLSKSLSARVLAYHFQADVFGDLGKEAVRLLDSIVDDLTAGKTPDIKPPMGRRLRAGSVLVREHNCVLHRVMVLEEGYAWEGKTFKSLSSAAKAITGTNWNGQRFFGLKEKVRSRSETTI